LAKLDGGSAPYIGDAKANVFVFFRPEQENSASALRQLQEAKTRLGERSVHWTTIVADTYPRESISRLVDEIGVDMAVLLDHDNELYGRLGVILHPVIGVADSEHVLRAYVPFRKLNLAVQVDAQVKHVLGEITDEQLEAVLNPQPIELGGNGTVAKRNLRMGQMFLKMKKYDAALQAAAKSMELDPELAGPYGLTAAAYAEQGDCEQAVPALRRALELDAEEPMAKAAAERCPAPE
jgi:tetratricopeptide (TPR) repeat protein